MTAINIYTVEGVKVAVAELSSVRSGGLPLFPPNNNRMFVAYADLMVCKDEWPVVVNEQIIGTIHHTERGSRIIIGGKIVGYCADDITVIRGNPETQFALDAAFIKAEMLSETDLETFKSLETEMATSFETLLRRVKMAAGLLPLAVGYV